MADVLARPSNPFAEEDDDDYQAPLPSVPKQKKTPPQVPARTHLESPQSTRKSPRSSAKKSSPAPSPRISAKRSASPAPLSPKSSTVSKKSSSRSNSPASSPRVSAKQSSHAPVSARSSVRKKKSPPIGDELSDSEEEDEDDEETEEENTQSSDDELFNQGKSSKQGSRVGMPPTVPRVVTREDLMRRQRDWEEEQHRIELERMKHAQKSQPVGEATGLPDDIHTQLDIDPAPGAWRFQAYGQVGNDPFSARGTFRWGTLLLSMATAVLLILTIVLAIVSPVAGVSVLLITLFVYGVYLFNCGTSHVLKDIQFVSMFNGLELLKATKQAEPLLVIKAFQGGYQKDASSGRLLPHTKQLHTEVFELAACEDISDEIPPDFPQRGLCDLRMIKDPIVWADARSKKKFDRAVQTMKEQFKGCQVYHELVISGYAYRTNCVTNELPSFYSPSWYWMFSACLLSWPYRRYADRLLTENVVVFRVKKKLTAK